MKTTTDHAHSWGDAIALIEELNKKLRENRTDDLSTVLASYESLFDRFCPFQVGERVKLSKTPEIKQGSGWWGSRGFLIQGEICIVTNHRSHRDGKFHFLVQFENDHWIDTKGTKHYTKPDIRHYFQFSEDWLEKIES